MNRLTTLEIPSGAVGIQWFGQSWFAFKDAQGTVLQVDPYGPRTRPADEFIHPESPLDEATLPTDFVLLTHVHGDHTCLESIFRIHNAFPATQFLGPAECTDLLCRQGIPASLLQTVSAGETRWLKGVQLHTVYAKPPAGLPAEGIAPPDVEHLGFVLDCQGTRVYISGDPVQSFSQHEFLLAPVRAHQPQLGLLTTHPTEGEFPLLDGSVEMAVKLKLQAAVPAHYACFVRRTYDPQQWAARFPADGPTPLLIPYGGVLVFRADSPGWKTAE